MQINKGVINMLFISIVGLFSTVSFSQQLDPVLTELINKGLNKSQTVNIKAIEAQQAKLDQRLAKSVFIPKVTFNGSFTRLNDDITFGEDTQNLLVATQKLVIKEALQIPFNAPFPGEIPLKDTPNLQDKNILKTSVDLDWVLFSGFEATIAIKASKHKESSLKYLGMAEKDKLALKIIEAYDKLALVYASEKVLNTSEKYLDEQAFYVKKAIENGLATPIGRKKIELAQQQLAGKKLEFEHNKTLLIEVLFQLTGESRENLRMLRPELETFSLNSNSNVEKRNEIKALEEAEQATIYKSKMEKSHFIPKVAVKGHYEFIEDYLSLLDPKWYVGVGIKWNVFDGNQSNLKAQKSKLESEIYRERIEEAEEMIDLSIVKAEQTYQSTLQNSKIVEKEIELATDTYEMVNKQFKNDLASINEVLDALTNLEKANFKLQESYFDQRRAVTEMLHAKGTLKY
ncbi:TolC family protein [Aequorivita sp. F47161]|jgi:outer membrane protein TolC|uniref:TolC family protein n=1 Tax=Aequorivita vitellina TaxID=2874475 RepID=A0A9X1U2J3_9FLAO|nr:TolC family protein [Aequorivita vitellina]MCG2419930.1 TolC family protein [Aequorivita vitellina]